MDGAFTWMCSLIQAYSILMQEFVECQTAVSGFYFVESSFEALAYFNFQLTH